MSQLNGRIRLGRSLLSLVAVVGVSLLYLLGYLFNIAHPSDADVPGCRQISMFPSYARLRAFDGSHTHLSSKYSLYLYREQGQDAVPDENNYDNYLSGIPVLFIPGNAGSYKQARSIAAETSNQYYHHEFSNPLATNFDFFTADFNEDFTAFHGRTIVDQAEYLNEAIKFILGLYEKRPDPPESVILLGHSMGGVVARVMLSLPNYPRHSVNTILTLATPHAAAPLTFDGDISKIYSAVDRFWHEGFSNISNSDRNHYSSVAKETLTNVTLISITGGLLDTTLPADYTTLGYLVPPSNGFTVYTTGIPSVWTPIDHLAIVWCDQLRKVVSKSLLAIADRTSPYKTLPLKERMKVFRKHFLTGFEDYSIQDSVALTNDKTKQESIHLKLDTKIMRSVKTGDKVLKYTPGNPIVNDDSNEKAIMNIFNIPVDSDSKSKFSLLSSVPIADWNTFIGSNSNVSPSILLCSNLKSSTNNLDKLATEGDKESAKATFDFTSSATSEYVALSCVDMRDDLHVVPRSAKDSQSLSDSSSGGHTQPFNALQFDSAILSKYDVIIVAESTLKTANLESSDDFVIAELSDYSSTQYDLGKDMLTLIRRGADVSLPPNRPLSTNLYIPGAWSSILAYKIKLVYSDNEKKGKKEGAAQGIPPPSIKDGSFVPFIRQWIDEPYETKWHINVEQNNDIILTMHGVAPYTPFKLKPDNKYGLNIEIWSDNSAKDEMTLDIILSIDYINSLRLLILRYRLALVCYCVSITLLAFLFQFNYFVSSNVFPNFIYGLGKICSAKVLGSILFILSITSPLVANSHVQKFLNFIDPVVLQDTNEIHLTLQDDFKLNAFFLGLEEPFLWIVGPIFFIMGIAIVLITYYALLSIGVIVSTLAKLVIFATNKQNKQREKKEAEMEMEKEEKNSPNENSTSSTPSPNPSLTHASTPSPSLLHNNATDSGTYAQSTTTSPYLHIKNPFNKSSKISIRRLFANILLLGTIPFFLPYQFAYMICATVQIITSLKLLCSNNINRSAFNYHLTLLVLMLWILPINVPVLIVFIHNLAVNWKTPFSSHHNILAILPILLLMERHASGYSLPKISKSATHPHNRSDGWLSKFITRSIIGYFIFYCIIYGVRHTFWLHHLLNIFFCWLLIFYFIHEK